MDKIDELLANLPQDSENTVEAKESVIGKFKPSKKFLKFVTIKGNIKYHTHEANISAEIFAGDRYKDVTLTLTICDNDTVNLDEIDTSKISESEKERFLEMICEREIIPLRGGEFALNLIFKPTVNAQEQKVMLYLAVEHTTPYNKLMSIFEDEVSVSDEQVSKIDSLFDGLDLEEELESTVIPSDELKEVSEAPIENIKKGIEYPEFVEITENEYLKKLNTDFEAAKKAKEDELTKRYEDKQKDLKKYKVDVRFAQSKVDEIQSELDLLESRLENIKPAAEPNGWVFCVSEGEKGIEELDPQFIEIINKKFKKSAEHILNVIKGTTFIIKLGKKDEFSAEVTPEILETLSKLDDEHLSLTETPGEFKYAGELQWHGIVEKMLKLGFEQDPEFDKISGSNSYTKDTTGTDGEGEVGEVENEQ